MKSMVVRRGRSMWPFVNMLLERKSSSTDSFIRAKDYNLLGRPWLMRPVLKICKCFGNADRAAVSGFQDSLPRPIRIAELRSHAGTIQCGQLAFWDAVHRIQVTKPSGTFPMSALQKSAAHDSVGSRRRRFADDAPLL